MKRKFEDTIWELIRIWPIVLIIIALFIMMLSGIIKAINS